LMSYQWCVTRCWMEACRALIPTADECPGIELPHGELFKFTQGKEGVSYVEKWLKSQGGASIWARPICTDCLDIWPKKKLNSYSRGLTFFCVFQGFFCISRMPCWLWLALCLRIKLIKKSGKSGCAAECKG
jgi:hypothetical protein